MKRPVACVLAVLLALLGAAPVHALGSTWQAKVDASVLQAASAGKTEFLVYLSAHANLSAADGLARKSAKGKFVYDALTQTASTSQAPVLSLLKGLGAPAQSFWISNVIATKGGLDVIQAVAQLSGVQAIYPSGRGELDKPVDLPGGTEAANLSTTVGPSIDHVNANEAWALGYKGQGAVIAGADTGVRWTHNALKSHYRGWNASTGTADHNYNWHDAIKWDNTVCPANSPQPCDDDIILGGGHGTHTMGTMLGDDGAGNHVGMAPDAKWMACRNMNFGVGAVPLYMDCMQWFIAPTDIAGNNPDPSKAPDVVNNSWGCVEGCAPPIMKDLIDASTAAGIFYVVSAGNDNQFFLGAHMQCDTIVWPLAVYESAFTVGATGATNDAIADYSSLGPVPDNVIEGVLYRKPDIVAPGSDIRSSTAGSDDEYSVLSGTSMAGPHVAGLVALIISANPALRGDVSTIAEIIRSTAKPLPSDLGCGGDSTTQVPNNVFGWGRIDALAAVQKAAQMREPEFADLRVTAMGASQQKPKAGDPVVVSATITNAGSSAASASNAEFRLADGTVLGVVDTPALAPGAAATVQAGWNTRGANGDYVVTATADKAGGVAESNEANNSANLAVSIRGNKVQNQSFEQPNSSGDAPESWQGSSTGAGTATYDQNSGSASDGADSASVRGNGGNAVLSGVPTWTSAPITVTPGETLTLQLDVKSVGLSSAPQVSVAYLGATGQLLSTVKVLAAPLTTNGTFKTLSQTLVVPANVTSLRIVLGGFSATDTRTAGTVSFDNVGLFGP